MKKYSVGIVGATGAVGKEMVYCLKKLNFPVSSVELFASERSAGKKVKNEFGEMTIQLFDVDRVKNLDIVLMAVDGSFAKEYAPKIAKGKAVVIDNSSAFRYDADVPLVVPEVNPKAIGKAKIIANPNCTTAILAVALWPLHQQFIVKKCIVSTYQAASGAGQEAMDELERETKNYLQTGKAGNEKFGKPIPFNLIPRIDVMQENGYTKEEMKVAKETRKIFGDEKMEISCTAVRIPTFRAHAESVTIETEKEISPEKARKILEKSSGVQVVDDPENYNLPMPLTATKKFDVEAGRIRQNLVFGKKGLDFFVCGDQLLKGAALNAVQIAEVVIGK